MKRNIFLGLALLILFGCKKNIEPLVTSEQFNKINFLGNTDKIRFNSIGISNSKKTLFTSDIGYYFADSLGQIFNYNKRYNFVGRPIRNSFSGTTTYAMPALVNGQDGIRFENIITGNTETFSSKELNLIDPNLVYRYYSYGLVRKPLPYNDFTFHYMINDTIKFLEFHEQSFSGYKLIKTTNVYQPFSIANSYNEYFYSDYGFLIYNLPSKTFRRFDYSGILIDSLVGISNIKCADDDFTYTLIAENGEIYKLKNGVSTFEKETPQPELIDFCSLNGDTVLELKTTGLSLINSKTKNLIKTIPTKEVGLDKYSYDWRIFYNDNIIYLYNESYMEYHKMFFAKKRIIY